MLLYTLQHTPRLRYIADFIGKELFGKSIEITSDAELFRQSSGAKINYSNSSLSADEYKIIPHSLLFETGIKEQPTDIFDTSGIKAFFKTGGDLAFDIFAASFYLLSRYEEYLPHKKDEYGRYAYENSLACKQDFLRLPLVNQWIEVLRSGLLKKYSMLPAQTSTFRFLPTYDIDEAYSYKHKGWWRSTGAIGKAWMKGEWSRIAQRRKVIAGKEKDPFDSYEWMDNLHKQYNLKPRYFFLVPEKTGIYDRNILPREKALQELIRHHAAKYDIGVHPSWQSGDDPNLLLTEIKTIEAITGKIITASRQHFIRLTLPQTFRRLLDAGIKEDFSMGYGSINGFRASVSSPFYWYDLEKEISTDLLLYPFCYMEANSLFEQKFTSQQALEEMRHYYNEVKAVNGMLITLWHNTFLGRDKLFEGWREVYESFIKEMR